jgi:hypothetical protein
MTVKVMTDACLSVAHSFASCLCLPALTALPLLACAHVFASSSLTDLPLLAYAAGKLVAVAVLTEVTASCAAMLTEGNLVALLTE